MLTKYKFYIMLLNTTYLKSITILHFLASMYFFFFYHTYLTMLSKTIDRRLSGADGDVMVNRTELFLM